MLIPTRKDFDIARVNGYSKILEMEMHLLIWQSTEPCHSNEEYYFNALCNTDATHIQNWSKLKGGWRFY